MGIRREGGQSSHPDQKFLRVLPHGALRVAETTVEVITMDNVTAMEEMPAPLEDFLAERVREVRSSKGWTQDELARRARDLGLSEWTRSVVAAIEHRNRRLSLGEAVTLAALLEVSLPDLFRSAPDELLVAGSLAISKEALIGSLAGANPAAFVPSGFRDLRHGGDSAEWVEIREEAFGAGKDLPEVWDNVAELFASSPDAEGRVTDRTDILRRTVEEDAAGEFERYIATRLGTTPEAVALAARLSYGTSATDERDRRARPGMPKHRESRQIVEEIETTLLQGPPVPENLRGEANEWLGRVMAAPVRRRSAVPSRRYQPLHDHLGNVSTDKLELTFDEVERVLGRDLPNSARRHRAWWANDPSHSHARSWLEAGWQVETADMLAGWVRFIRGTRAMS